MYWEGFQTSDKQFSQEYRDYRIYQATDLQTIALELGKCESQIVLLEEPNYGKLQKILSIRVLQP